MRTSQQGKSVPWLSAFPCARGFRVVLFCHLFLFHFHFAFPLPCFRLFLFFFLGFALFLPCYLLCLAHEPFRLFLCFLDNLFFLRQACKNSATLKLDLDFYRRRRLLLPPRPHNIIDAF